MDLLGRSGYTVLTAVDWETALQISRKEQRRIDLVILDLTMPGMRGGNCLEQLLNPHYARATCCDPGSGHPSGRPRVSNLATY